MNLSKCRGCNGKEGHGGARRKINYLVGTMIEVPRAAITASEIAKAAQFFSFGTNDLTQMTFGFSRDDAGKFLPYYYEKKIFESDPFARLDRSGVGKLVEMAVEGGRKPVPTSSSVSAANTAATPARLSFATTSGWRTFPARLSECLLPFLRRRRRILNTRGANGFSPEKPLLQ